MDKCDDKILGEHNCSYVYKVEYKINCIFLNNE